MGWANGHIARLQTGNTVTFRPRGHSMTPLVKSGQLCTVEPVQVADVKVGDIVLCKVMGRDYLHLVKAVRDGLCQIGNNKGHINGWTKAVYGRLVQVDP